MKLILRKKSLRILMTHSRKKINTRNLRKNLMISSQLTLISMMNLKNQ